MHTHVDSPRPGHGKPDHADSPTQPGPKIPGRAKPSGLFFELERRGLAGLYQNAILALVGPGHSGRAELVLNQNAFLAVVEPGHSGRAFP